MSASFLDRVATLADPSRKEAPITDDAALFVGRFQPYHRGHAHVVKQLASVFSEVVVCIGSAEKSYRQTDPFSAGERHEMIRDTCRAENLRNVSICAVEDSPNNAVWLAHIKQACPPFQVVVGNNAGVLVHFPGQRVMRPEHFQRDVLVGTSIRRLMVAGDVDAVRALVPDATMRVLLRIGAFERLRGLNGIEELQNA